MRAQKEAEDGKVEEDDDDEAEVWTKALNTEKMLREELALHKRLPRDVQKTRSLINLIKLLLRLKKLYSARSCAIKILRALTTFRGQTRCGIE